jgi:uncharacterized protein (TIGR00369 family)
MNDKSDNRAPRYPFVEIIERMIAGQAPLPPVSQLVGFRPVEITPGRALFEMSADRRHANPMGTLHGGILCDIADAALGVAWASELTEGETFTTLDLKINFLKPVWEAKITAEAQVIKRGKTVGLAECHLRDEKGDLIAHATATQMTLRGEQAKGR